MVTKAQAIQALAQRKDDVDRFVEHLAKSQALQVSRERHIINTLVEEEAEGQAQQATGQLKLHDLVEMGLEGQALQAAIRWQLRQLSQS